MGRPHGRRGCVSLPFMHGPCACVSSIDGFFANNNSVAIIEYTYLLKTDWHKAALEAEARNAAG